MLGLGCSAGTNQQTIQPREVVLKPGQRVEFRNRFGSGTISYVAPLQRAYTFEDGSSQTVTMIAREERFLGKLGIYEPAERWWYQVGRGPRLVVSEAEMHFHSLAEAKKYLVKGSAVLDWVYNQDGYVVGFSRTPERDQINVTLYRYFINGSPAHKMPGYDNTKVKVISSLRR